jgi:hypothetical protein
LFCLNFVFKASLAFVNFGLFLGLMAIISINFDFLIYVKVLFNLGFFYVNFGTWLFTFNLSFKVNFPIYNFGLDPALMAIVPSFLPIFSSQTQSSSALALGMILPKPRLKVRNGFPGVMGSLSISQAFTTSKALKNFQSHNHFISEHTIYIPRF